MDMPGYLDYQKMAMQDPVAYEQSLKQLNLAQMYQAERQKQAENMSLEGMLKNDQSRKMNPMLLEKQGLENLGTGLDNTRKGQVNEDAGMTLGLRKKTFSMEEEQKIQDFALKADDNKLKSIEQKIQLGIMSGDPAQVEQAMKAEEMLKAVREAKLAHTRKMEETRFKELQATGRNLDTIAGNERIANIRATASGKGSATSTPDFWSAFYNKNKSARDKHALLVTEIAKRSPDDPELGILRGMAEAIRPQAEAEIASVKPGGIDTGAVTGMPVQPGPNIKPPNIAPKETSPVMAPVAPTGRTVIYKDGKAVGSVPNSQVKEAQAQGYTLK